MISTVIRISQLVAGIIAVLLSLFLFLHLTIKDSTLESQFRAPFPEQFVAFLMMVLPGVAVVIGSYVQAIRRRVWGAALVFVGGLGSFFLVFLNAGLAYALLADVWGQRVLVADLLAVVLTMGTALINLLISAVMPKARNSIL